MRQKIVLYGNCQGKALKSLFDYHHVFQKHFDIINFQVHLIKPNKIQEFTEKVKGATYFIHQPVGNYKGFQELSSNYLRNLVSNPSKAISFPSIYFDGYTPHAVHLKKKDGSRFPSLQKNSNVHDRNILFSFYEGKTINETHKLITKNDFYDQKSSLDFVNNSIKELERREKQQNLDVTVSDLVRRNYQKHLLFNTVNHPSTELLKQVAAKIATKIGIDFNKQLEILPNVLKVFSLFIYPSTYKNLELSFPHQYYYKYNNTKIGVKKNIEQMFALYESNRDEIEYAISGIKAHDFVAKTFALEIPEFIDQAEKEIGSNLNNELIKKLEKGETSRKEYVQNIYINSQNSNTKVQRHLLSIDDVSKYSYNSQISSQQKKQNFYRKFFVITHARSGSNLLNACLRTNPHIFAAGELFAQHNRKNGENFDTILSELFSERDKKIELVGCKLFYYHLTDTEWQKLIDMPDLKIIHLIRKNTLRTLTSLKIAANTGKWRISEKTKSIPLTKKKVTFNCENLRKRMEKIELWQLTTIEKFENHSLCNVYYEDIVSNTDTVMKSISNFLGLETKLNFSLSLKKQNPEPLSNLIENYQELSNYFKNTKWEHFLDE